MRKVEMTIAPTYVANWGLAEGVRELLQNAMDQSAISGNKWFYEHDSEAETLKIVSKDAKLGIESLLLGATTKANDERTVGQFGEGYKIATLVLIRAGKNVVFYNGSANEVWRPRFVKSRKFKTDVLTFFIESKKQDSNDLTIEISDISEDDWNEEVVKSCLDLQDDFEVLFETHRGRAIKGDKVNGKVYVSGLYVCDYDGYKYGYDFKPGTVKLDRDRKMASAFELRWEASHLWGLCPRTPELLDIALKLIEEAKDDVYNIEMWENTSLTTKAVEEFKDTYGDNAYPVTSQADLEELPADLNGVIVSSQMSSVLKAHSSYAAVPKTIAVSDMLRDLHADYNKLAERLQSLVGDIEDIEDYDSDKVEDAKIITEALLEHIRDGISNLEDVIAEIPTDLVLPKGD